MEHTFADIDARLLASTVAFVMIVGWLAGRWPGRRLRVKLDPQGQTPAAGGKLRGAVVPRARGLSRATSRSARSLQEKGGEVMARFAKLISIAFIVVASAGCSTAPSRFYSLDSTATADGTPATSATGMVGPVKVPASAGQPEF